MMKRPVTIALLIFIAAAIMILLSRRASDPVGVASSRSGSRNEAIHPGGSASDSRNHLPSKAGSRAPRTRAKTITTPSGLQYEILVEGTGPRPGPTDMVRVHYHGTTLDGTVFDSSIERGTPAGFPLDKVIKGWTEGLQLMRVGSKYRFTIPPELAYGKTARKSSWTAEPFTNPPERAYGKTGVGDKIGPDETLVFEVELLEIPPTP